MTCLLPLLWVTDRFWEYFSLCPAGSHVKVQTNERLYSRHTVCWPDTMVRCTTSDRFIMLQAVQILQQPVNTTCIWPSLIRVRRTYSMYSALWWVIIWSGISVRTFVETFNTMTNGIVSCCASERLHAMKKKFTQSEIFLFSEAYSLPKYILCSYPHISAAHRPISQLRALTHRTVSALPLKFTESGLSLMLSSNHVLAHNEWIAQWWQSVG